MGTSGIIGGSSLDNLTKNAAVKIPKDYLMDSVIVMEFVLCKRTMREFKNNPVSVYQNQGYL